MRSSSDSSSRSSSPMNRRRRTSKFEVVEDIINKIIIFISITLIILIPYVILASIKRNCNKKAIHASFISSMLFHFLMIIQVLIRPERHNFLTIWYNIHFHYFLNNIFIYYSGINLYPLFISIGSRALFALFKGLDKICSKKTGELARLVLSFTKPAINSIHLHRFAAILEILEMPYLVVSAFIISRNVRILVVLIVNIFFLLMCYQTDPYHKWVWKTIREYLVNRSHRYRDSFGPILSFFVSIFDFFSRFAQFLFPPGHYISEQ